MKRRISVRAIVLQGNELLCVRQRPYNDLSRSINEHWNLPGGGLDEGETLRDCLQREMLEETGIAAKPGNLMYIQQFAHAGIEYLEFFYHITNGADYTAIDLSQTSHGELEIAEIAFINPKAVPVLPSFLASVELQRQTTLPTSVYSYL